MDLTGKTLLLTGGTGSFGRAFVERLLGTEADLTIRVLSRDELKQSEMQRRFGDDPNENAEGSSADGRGMNTVSGVKERCGIERPSRTNRSMGCHKMSSG